MMFGDKSLEIAHVGIDNTGRSALQHVEASDLAGRAALVNFEQLANANRQWQALPSRSVLQASTEVAAIQRNHRAGVQAEPTHGHRQRFRVILREVGEIELDPRISERYLLAIAADDLTARDESSRVESAGAAALSRTEISDDIEEGFQTGLHAGVGSVSIDFKNEIGL